MRGFRFTIGSLMGVVLVLAIGFAALKDAGATWASVIFLLTCGVLGLAVIGATFRRGADRAGWLGFALFGWGYMALAFWHSESMPTPPTLALLKGLLSVFGATPW